MKTFVYGTAAAMALIAIAPGAGATDIPLIQNGNHYTADYGNEGLSGPFSDSFTFTPSIDKSFADIQLIQGGSDPISAITFTELKLDNHSILSYLNVLPDGDGSWLILSHYALSGGEHTLTVGGTAGGDASYAGTINLVLSPIPEPATWAMMVVGIAAVGMTLRSRARLTRIAFS